MAKLKIESQFGLAPNSLVYNEKISLAAKGLYVYIQAKPQDWLFSAERITIETNDSLYAVKKTLRELEEFGYLTRTKFKDEKGRWDIQYILHLKPTVEIEPRTSSTVEYPPSDIRPTYKERLTNKDYISNIEDSNYIDSNITIDNTNTREENLKTDFELNDSTALFREVWISFLGKRNSFEKDYTNFLKKSKGLDVDFEKLKKAALNTKDIYFQSWLNQQLPKRSKNKIYKSFIIPSIEDIRSYCQERQNYVNAEKFHSHYTSIGWKVGKNPMVDWKAAVRTWEKNYNNKANYNGTEQQPQQERFIGRQSQQQVIDALEREQACSYDPRFRE